MRENELKDITKKSGVVFAGRIIGAVFAFLFNIAAARFMGARAYGMVTYVFTIIIFFSMITKLGLSQGLVKHVSRLTESGKIDKRNSVITFSIILVTFLSSLLALALFLGSERLALQVLDNPELTVIIKTMAPLLVFYSLIELSPGIFRGVKIIRYHVIGKDIIFSLVKLITVIIAGFIGYRVSGLIVSYYLSLILAFIYLYFRLAGLNLFSSISSQYWGDYRQLLAFSFPLLMSGLLYFFITKTDIFMIGYFIDSTRVGIYNIALRAGTLTSFVLVAFNTMFAPTISTLYHRGEMEVMKEMYQVITKWILAVNLMAFSLILLFSGDIMSIFGPEFVVGGTVLILIASGQVVNAGVGTAGSLNVMTGFPQSEMYINIFVFILNVILNYYLIPIYGIEGAAFASLLSVVAMNITRLIIMNKRLGFLPYNRDYINILISALLAFLITLFIREYLDLNYFIRIIISTFIYLFVFIFINIKLGISSEDKMILNSIGEKVKKILNN